MINLKTSGVVCSQGKEQISLTPNNPPELLVGKISGVEKSKKVVALPSKYLMTLNTLFENFSSHLHKAETDSSDAESQRASEQTDSYNKLTASQFIILLTNNIKQNYNEDLKLNHSNSDDILYQLNEPKSICYLKISIGVNKKSWESSICLNLNLPTIDEKGGIEIKRVANNLTISCRNGIYYDQFFKKYIFYICDCGIITKEQTTTFLKRGYIDIIGNISYDLLKATIHFVDDMITKYSV